MDLPEDYYLPEGFTYHKYEALRGNNPSSESNKEDLVSPNFEVFRSKRYPTINGEEEEVTVPATIDNLCSYQHDDDDWYLLGGQSQNAWIGKDAFDVVDEYFLSGNTTDRHVILRYR